MVKSDSRTVFQSFIVGSRKTDRWMAAAIVVTLIVAYAQTLRVPFLLDDQFSITDNPSIRSLWALDKVLAPPSSAPSAGRPLFNLSLAANYAISGLEPWSYHVVNLTIHVLAALTLFGVVRRTLLTPALKRLWGESAGWLAGVIALLWGIHPLQTQTVTYISQRCESLMALFYLFTLYSFIRGSENRTKLWHSLAVASCFLGAMSKEVIVTAPAMVWLYDRTFVAGSFHAALRARKAFYTAMASMWIVIAALMLDVKNRGVGFGIGVSSFHYALTQCKAIMVYLGLCLWPHPLIFDRGDSVITSVREALAYMLMLAGLGAAVVCTWRRSPILGFAPVWFLVLLAPASSVVPVAGATVAENRVYLPLAGVVVLVVLAVHFFFKPRKAGALCAILAMAAIVTTVGRNRDFQSAIGIWTDTIEKNPNNPRAHNNLANVLATIPGRQPEAVAHYEAALRLQPDFVTAHFNLANLLSAIPNRQLEAVAHYEAALRLKPDYPEAHNNLANVLATIPGRQPEAVTHYETALRLKADNPEAHNNLANVLAAIPNRQLESVAHYEAALRLKPDYPEAHNNLANVLATIPDRRLEAVAQYEAALRLKPDYPQAHNNLAKLLATIPDRRLEAVTHYEAALRLKPDFAAAHYNLANLLSAIPNQQEEALAHFEAAARLLPFNAAVHFSFARYLEGFEGRSSEALLHYSAALRIDPNFNGAQEAIERLQKSNR